MFQSLGKQGASIPLLSILIAIATGAIAVWIQPLYIFLNKIQKSITSIGRFIGYIMIPLILCFGITIGVKFGARIGMGHYLTMVIYTFLLSLVWWLFYVFFIIKILAKQPVKKVIKEYFAPTAMVAAGTCSSMATLPVNLIYAKRYGIRDEVADFIIPFGAVFNLNASALAYLAYAPFVMSYIYHFEISWTMLFMAWPALVLFTIAAPGLPAGMGTSLWAATLFSSILGLEDPVRASFIATWIALSGGLPDMFRTAMNCTGDGFTAMVFDQYFDRLFKKKKKS
jgi:Na+/H+-dicarboxylate symporter